MKIISGSGKSLINKIGELLPVFLNLVSSAQDPFNFDADPDPQWEKKDQNSDPDPGHANF